MAIGGFAVKTLLNQPSYQINREIEAFFASGAKDDLLLLYFSGHGLKDEMGRLYFATTDTDRRFLRSTAVSAALLHDLMNDCNSRRQVLLLDCCYSGAFARGKTHHKAGETVDIGEYFGQGRGQFVLTASDAMQYAFEGDAISGEGLRSVFTDTLVQGLGTGEADLDGDGAISCDELYRYLCERIADRMPQQKPRKWAFAAEGDIIIARNPRPIIKPVALPIELQQSIEDPRPWVREGAARHLGDLLQNGNKGLAAAAQAALQGMTEDDSLKVRAVVAEILKAESPPAKLPEPAPDKAKARPTLPAIQNIHSWSAQQVQTLQQQTAQAFGLAVEFRDQLQDGSAGPTMVVIPSGRFLMGSPSDEPERQNDERQHEAQVAVAHFVEEQRMPKGVGVLLQRLLKVQPGVGKNQAVADHAPAASPAKEANHVRRHQQPLPPPREGVGDNGDNEHLVGCVGKRLDLVGGQVGQAIAVIAKCTPMRPLPLGIGQIGKDIECAVERVGFPGGVLFPPLGKLM